MSKPVLAVDVDGVLNAMNAMPSPADGWADAQVGPFRIRYNPAHGARLVQAAEDAGAELAWCTTWEDKANLYIRQLVGLPELPVVPMAPGRAGLSTGYRSVGHVKAIAMAAWAGDRPFCWLDDEHDAAFHLAGCLTPHLVVHIPPVMGLQENHIREAVMWLKEQK